MKLRTILASFAAALVASCSHAQPSDAVLLEMQQAFRQDNKARLAQLLPAAQGHPLEAWAAYWELKARLQTATLAEVQAFLARYAGSYQEDRLRNDWLLLMGQRRDWDSFAQEYPRFRMNDDRQVRCYALALQFMREGPNAPAGLADEVRRNWLAARDDDDGCTFAAGRLLAASGPGPRLAEADAWHKARLAMEAGRFKSAAAAVGLVHLESLPLLAEVQASPTKFLRAHVTAASRARKEIVGLALIKLATSDIENAAAQLDSKWGAQLGPEERDWVWGVIGRRAAQRLSPEAHGYFAKVEHDKYLHDEQLEWKVRAALRAGSTPHWRTVLQSVNAMSPEAQAEPAWSYWKARALLASGNEPRRAEAQKLLQGIASPAGFYGQLALEELGQLVTVPPRPVPVTPLEKQAAAANPGLQRALYAIRIGLRSEGVREWNYTTNLHTPGGMPERELLAAAQLACDQEVWDRCINTSERTKAAFDFAQRYPTPFRDAVVRRATEIGLDPAYVYGLIRQESRFIMDARSHVGASGLMQVMPATARWTAKRIGLDGFQAEHLNDRDTNIAIGTGYLKLVLDDFEGSMAMAAAAYNAGPGRPRSWRNGPLMEAAAWAENVPFTETRDYVKKVLANTTFYAAMLSGQPQSLKARLATVGPRVASLPEPNRALP